MQIDYFKNLITGYLTVNGLSLDSVEYEKLNNSIYITIHNIPSNNNAYEILDIVLYTTNILNQISHPAYHMQNIYREDMGHWLEATYLEFSITDYEKLNAQLNNALNNNAK